jgi:small subunit ribosomal protein S2
MTKKELLMRKREKDKLERTLGGIRDMAKVPSAVWIVDTKKEHIAVNEARKLGIPVVAILDTNCDPDEVDYPIPGNDDAIRSVSVLTRVVADAVADGLIARAGAATSGDEKPAAAGTEEPLAEWERELLERDKGTDTAIAADQEPTGAAVATDTTTVTTATTVTAAPDAQPDETAAETTQAAEAADVVADAVADVVAGAAGEPTDEPTDERAEQAGERTDEQAGESADQQPDES